MKPGEACGDCLHAIFPNDQDHKVVSRDVPPGHVRCRLAITFYNEALDARENVTAGAINPPSIRRKEGPCLFTPSEYESRT